MSQYDRLPKSNYTAKFHIRSHEQVNCWRSRTLIMQTCRVAVTGGTHGRTHDPPPPTGETDAKSAVKPTRRRAEACRLGGDHHIHHQQIETPSTRQLNHIKLLLQLYGFECHSESRRDRATRPRSQPGGWWTSSSVRRRILPTMVPRFFHLEEMPTKSGPTTRNWYTAWYRRPTYVTRSRIRGQPDSSPADLTRSV